MRTIKTYSQRAPFYNAFFVHLFSLGFLPAFTLDFSRSRTDANSVVIATNSIHNICFLREGLLLELVILQQSGARTVCDRFQIGAETCKHSERNRS